MCHKIQESTSQDRVLVGLMWVRAGMLICTLVLSQHHAQEGAPQEEIWVENIGSGVKLLSLPRWLCLLAGWPWASYWLSLYFHSFIRRMEISTAFPHWVVGGTQEMNLVPCMYSMLNNGGCCLFPTWLTSKAMAVCPRTSLILRASRIIVVPEVSCVTKIGNASCLIFGTLIWGKKNFFWFKSSVWNSYYLTVVYKWIISKAIPQVPF